jgi:hypothetical protein
MRICFTKFTIFLHRITFVINTHFTPLRETLYAGLVKLSVDALEPSTRGLLDRVCTEDCREKIQVADFCE